LILTTLGVVSDKFKKMDKVESHSLDIELTQNQTFVLQLANRYSVTSIVVTK